MKSIEIFSKSCFCPAKIYWQYLTITIFPFPDFRLSLEYLNPVYKNNFLFSVSAAGKKLTVSDETERTMKVTWTPAPGKVTHYRLKYVPIGGGKEAALKIPGTTTSTVMKRLQPTTTYNIIVHPIYKRGEGKARQGVGTTRTLVHNSTVHCRNMSI